MKKLFFVPFVLMLLFAACSKDSNIIPANENVLNAQEEHISYVVPSTDGTTDRSTCNLYMKIAFRKTATYSGLAADLLPCNRFFRVMRNNGGVITQIFPASGYFGSGTSTSTGNNLSLVVPNGGQYYVEFDTVVDPTNTFNENTYVFFSDNILVQIDPLTHADVSWSHHVQIGPAATPDVASSNANVSATCVVTP